MPTIPPTCVPLDPLTSIALPDPDFFSGEGLVNGPTPDPDDDDVMFVQPDSGMVSQDSLSQCPPQAIAKPHNVDPASLILHSPSSIIGTPFDPSPRFEYPFPTSAAPADIIQELEPIVPSFHLISPAPAFPSIMPPLPLPGSLPLMTVTVSPVKSRPETRNFSPTHPKLQARDPPVPPGLKHKLNQNGTGAAATIKIHGFDITSLTLPTLSSVGRGRGVSLSTLTDKHAHEPLGEAQILNSRPETASVTKAGGIGEKQARVANKWKRHTLARCERDREFVVDAQATSAKR
ncbi:hypothetical protein GSI_02349 [Ganoderma sinense ZZ0214-1]|uniref:Uncharacterized protein n=1 Tax=Ganoderma sinense ZZ0214-1 TaxID=1077348 RepID=A0A2G8SPC3_9APHY|nr:hypothetical protein GSI_02349 [Ganoderma sinense ZZ0214-1]